MTRAIGVAGGGSALARAARNVVPLGSRRRELLVRQRTTFYRVLDRRYLRPVLAIIASAVHSLQSRRMMLLWPTRDGWWHVEKGGSMIWPTLQVRSRDGLDAQGADICFHRYRPRVSDVVVDVGAGVGEEVRLFSEAVGPTGLVVAIEAHPLAFSLLRRNVAHWRLRNVRTVHAAISDEPGTVTLSDDGASVGNRIAHEGVQVPATTIGRLLSDLNLVAVDYLKMNIEGAERVALIGMQPSIDQISNLCISCHDFLARDEETQHLATSGVVRDFLVAQGFDVSQRSGDRRPWVNFYLYGSRTVSV